MRFYYRSEGSRGSRRDGGPWIMAAAAEFERAVPYDPRMSAMPFPSSDRYGGWDACREPIEFVDSSKSSSHVSEFDASPSFCSCYKKSFKQQSAPLFRTNELPKKEKKKQVFFFIARVTRVVV